MVIEKLNTNGLHEEAEIYGFFLTGQGFFERVVGLQEETEIYGRFLTGEDFFERGVGLQEEAEIYVRVLTGEGFFEWGVEEDGGAGLMSRGWSGSYLSTGRARCREGRC